MAAELNFAIDQKHGFSMANPPVYRHTGICGRSILHFLDMPKLEFHFRLIGSNLCELPLRFYAPLDRSHERIMAIVVRFARSQF